MTRREFSKSAGALAALAAVGPAAILARDPERDRLPAVPERAFTFHNLAPIEQFLDARFGLGPDLHESRDGVTWSCTWERARREWRFRDWPGVRYGAAWAIRKVPGEIECERRLLLALREFSESERPGTGGGIEARQLAARFDDAGNYWIATVDNLTVKAARDGFRYPVWLYERGRTA